MLQHCSTCVILCAVPATFAHVALHYKQMLAYFITVRNAVIRDAAPLLNATTTLPRTLPSPLCAAYKLFTLHRSGARSNWRSGRRNVVDVGPGSVLWCPHCGSERARVRDECKQATPSLLSSSPPPTLHTAFV